MTKLKDLIDQLYKNNYSSRENLLELLTNIDEGQQNYLTAKAHETRLKYYGPRVFIRGLVEFTNYCRRNCVYCGIRAANKNVQRYRLSFDQIIATCSKGYRLGYRTFVLQGGEDAFYSDETITEVVKELKNRYPDCAVTLSIGEKAYDSYKKYYEAGADRYLLRHETAAPKLYESLHPGMSFENRIKCLFNLKKIGYQVGAGFMVGLPNQTDEDLVLDLLFLQELQPHMAGIGPFIPHQDTPLGKAAGGTAHKTITLLAIIRLLLPEVLLPATTALGTIDPLGREKGFKAGANVVMPNLTPVEVRHKYALYNDKVCTGEEAAECRQCIENRIMHAGFVPDMSRGDSIMWERKQRAKYGQYSECK